MLDGNNLVLKEDLTTCRVSTLYSSNVVEYVSTTSIEELEPTSQKG